MPKRKETETKSSSNRTTVGFKSYSFLLEKRQKFAAHKYVIGEFSVGEGKTKKDMEFLGKVRFHRAGKVYADWVSQGNFESSKEGCPEDRVREGIFAAIRFY